MLMYICKLYHYVMGTASAQSLNSQSARAIVYTHTHTTYMHVNTHILIEILKCNLGILEVQEHSRLRKRYIVRLQNINQK